MSHETALNALRAAVPNAASSVASEWLNGIPSGWAPIIANDMATAAAAAAAAATAATQSTATQRPLSDAYLAGMPSKRRRLMKPINPNQLSDVPASIQQVSSMERSHEDIYAVHLAFSD